MKEVKREWIKNNAPFGATHIRETVEYMYFINPQKPHDVTKVKKPDWMKNGT